jgi:hypothetical protein
MATKAEQKAAKAEAKAAAKPTPGNIAKAATLSAKAGGATKQQAKAAGSQAKSTVASLQNTQKLEVKAVQQQFGKAAANAEKAVNKTELANFITGMLSNNFKATGSPLTQASTYDPNSQAYQRVQDAYGLFNQYNLNPAQSVKGGTAGIPLTKIDDYLQSGGTKGGNVAKLLDRMESVYSKIDAGQTLTAEDLAFVKANGESMDRLKAVKGQEGLYSVKYNGITEYYKRNEDGSYIPISADRFKADSGGFFGTDLGKALAVLGTAALTFLPGGQALAMQAGSFLSGGALSGAAATALGNAAIRGVATGAITGSAQAGLVAAALSGAGSALNLSGTMGNIFDSVGLGDFKDAFGVIGGNVSDASFAAADAAQLASQGLGADQIASTLIQQSGLSPVVAQAAAQAAVTGGGEAAIRSAITTTQASQPAPITDLSVRSPDSLATTQTNTAQGLFQGGAPITDISVLYDPNYVEPSMMSSFGNLGEAIAETLLAGNSVAAVASMFGLNTGQVQQIADAFGLGGGGGGMGGFNLGNMFGNLAGTAIDYAALDRIAKEGQKFGKEMEQKAVGIGQQAQTPFTPYTLTTGAGTATIGPGGASATAAPEYEALRRQALEQSGQALSAINPAQSTQQFYQNLEALAGPTRAREQESMLSSLGARGLLGIGRNLPTAGGEIRGVNPYMESLLSAQEQGRIQQALTAQQYGTSEAARMQQLAQALQTQGMGIDKQTMDQLAQARTLGLDERALAERNAAILANAQMRGLELRMPYDLLGLEAQAAGITGVAGIGRGMLGLPTQPGYTSSGGGLFDYLF